jgi:cell division protein ZapA
MVRLREREEIRGGWKMLGQIESISGAGSQLIGQTSEEKPVCNGHETHRDQGSSNNAVGSRFSTSPTPRGSDAEYILKLAEYVDGKMRAVSEQTHTVDTARLAVLAALNIADEYHLVKRNQDVGSSDYLRRAQHLSSALDEVLEDKRRAG